jgi:hypothetical protein
MPLPLLLLVPSVAAGLYGAYKGVSAVVDKSDANDISSNASSIARRAENSLEAAKQKCNKTLEEYGRKKMQAFTSTIPGFIDLFSKIKDVDIEYNPNLDNLHLGDFSKQVFSEIKSDYNLLISSGLGVGAGLTGGAATAFGAYSGTMMLASAGTGTAISSLGGVAATNATLAWLGGGTLAAGGGGMAMGAMVLGGLVAGPALAIFGTVMGNKAESALYDARSNLTQAKAYAEEVNLTVQKLDSIKKIVHLASTVFSKMSGNLRRSNSELKNLIESKGVDFKSYDDNGKTTVFKAVKSVQLLKAMIDTSIISQDGGLILESEAKLLKLREASEASS